MNEKYQMLDLFSGIGGFRLGLEKLGFESIGFSEVNKKAIETYKKNFDVDREKELGDIRNVEMKEIPPCDILCAGFPCQSFSIAGHQKGFEDARGTLFYDLAKVIEGIKPRFFILENVKNLVHHNGGETMNVILNLLGDIVNGQRKLSHYKDNLGYVVNWKVLKASDYNLPQARERTFIVGRRFKGDSFKWPRPYTLDFTLSDALTEDVDGCEVFLDGDDLEKVKGFGADYSFGGYVADEDIPDVYGTITASYGKITGNSMKIKRNGEYSILTPRECARLQGFPDSFELPEKPKDAYKQVGNAVPVNIIEKLGEKIVEGMN